MMIRIAATLALLGATTLSPARGDGPAAEARKKVLVELYTSQGCDSCPAANEFLGELAKRGFGPDQVVPVAFHVDYFNQPWADPFSSKDYSKRELAYNAVKKRNDLYFTPMMMVDGRFPMLGSNRTEAAASIRKAMAERPGVSLRLALTGTGPDRSLAVEVGPLASSIAGRDLMVGVAVTEGPVSTRVTSGENAGKTLVEHFAVRSFAFQKAKFDASGSRGFAFPLRLGADPVARNCRVAAFVQDWDGGIVYQADSLPWEAEVGAR